MHAWVGTVIELVPNLWSVACDCIFGSPTVVGSKRGWWMPHTIWLEAQRRLRDELGEKDYETWIEPLRPTRWSAGVLTLEVASAFARDWLKQHHLPAIARAVGGVTGASASVTLLVNRTLDVPARGGALPARRAERPTGSPPARYTFESFVVGASNRLAYGAARAVVAQPGVRYNPLFLHGACGLGKTHLLNAVANALAVERPLGTVACLSAENFVNEMILAIEGRRMERFRRRFRGIQTLVVDDVQFLADKRRSQEEFCHTFNALHEGSRQIVIASDRAPHEMHGIESALRDRFASGLLAELEPPDAELRLALVARKASALGLGLPPEVVSALADGWAANGRALEGALTKLDAFATLAGRPITLALVHEALGEAPAARNGAPSLEKIIGVVCEHFQLTRREIGSPRRTARLAVPRQVAMYLCKRLTKHSFPEIGREYGGKHHTTVMHSVEKIDALTKDDRNFHRVISELIDTLCS